MLELQETMIRYGQIVPNNWQLHEAEGLPPDNPGWMVMLDEWKAHGPHASPRQFPMGIVLPTDADLADLGVDAAALAARNDVAFLAVFFPQYGDGRGYSLARILREEYEWKGEIRALGDVLIDTVYYLSRCGFDSFVTKDGHDPAEALASLNTFTEHYQSDVDNYNQ